MGGEVSAEESRRSDVGAVVDGMEHRLGLALSVDVEDSFLLLDAMRSYIGGADAGTIFCAHASCERDLAFIVQESNLNSKGSDRWGLGQIVAHLDRSGVLPAELTAELIILNDHRKTLYHYGHSRSDTALIQRTHDYVGRIGASILHQEFERRFKSFADHKELFNFAMRQVLRENALSAFSTAINLRSWIAGKNSRKANTSQIS